MKILVINCGSSSLKYQFIDMENEEVIAKGLAERIGIDGSVLNHQPKGFDKIRIERPMPTHKEALQTVVDALRDKEYGVIKDMGEITAVGHRVVHAGEKFAYSVLLKEEVMDALKECISLAPLHNPPNIMGIEACKQIMPEVPMVGVFDTAFHQTMPKKSYIYPIPYEYYEKYRIRRYGFHGTSHKYVAERAAAMLGKPVEELKIITCHLGNGASITAVKNGISVDTSMGFTPLEGLAMGTRSGNIDAAIIKFLMEKENISVAKADEILNKKSGVLGISGVSSDFRDIEEAANKGNERAQLALDVYVHYVKKYIGAYAAVMNGVDAIVFTAGLGENSASMRSSICKDMSFLGVELDEAKNNVRGKETDVSKDGSKVRVLLIPTNEELMIARDTAELAGKAKK
ncbi:MAG TPA: acetate kinase [Bacillota bacterium]|nr:acetate kinase [Clostridiaceae bacterium]HNT03075.1 acetate kinase [Bacillota bacterium]HPA54110.1 acetate kinase [Bacillota bacterium]HPW40772.1 acetate kinase [Bacillota bacterium]HPX68512.1 acetate kinase [Bacillota bacterium]